MVFGAAGFTCLPAFWFAKRTRNLTHSEAIVAIAVTTDLTQRPACLANVIVISSKVSKTSGCPGTRSFS